jgi:hypothetical protein
MNGHLENMLRRLPHLIVVLLALVAAPSADAAKVAIYQNVDNFSGKTLYFTASRKTKLEGGSFISMRYVSFQIEAMSPIADPSKPYTIHVEAMLPEWMFISSGESLALKVDGEMITLNGPGSIGSREVLGADDVEEDAYYPLSVETTKKLAAAKEIQFRIYGERQNVTGNFTDDIMEDLRYFVEQAPILTKMPDAIAATPTQLQPQRFGATFIALTDALADTMKVPRSHGVFVVKVEDTLPAAAAGIKVGDVITSFDGAPIDTPAALQAAVAAHKAGAPAAVVVITAGSPERTVKVGM